MDASAATHGAIARNDLRYPLAALARLLCAATLALVALAATLIWLRRVSGNLVTPLPTAGMLTVGATISLAALVFRCGCLPASFIAHRSWSDRIAFAMPTVVAVLSAAAISLRESMLPGLAALWILVIVEETSAWGAALRRARVMRRVRSVGIAREVLAENLRVVSVPVAREELDETIGSPLDDPATTQCFVRRRDESGAEVIEGWVRAEFAASQRHGTVHLAICPPLDRTPECYAELGEGPGGEVKAAQVLPWGVRLEIKLDEPTTEQTSALVEISIVEVPEQDR